MKKTKMIDNFFYKAFPRIKPKDYTGKITKFLTLLINFSAGDKSSSKVKAKSRMKDNIFIDKIIHTLRGIHTHNIKIPDTSRSGQIYLSPTRNPEPEAGIYSQTIQASKYFAWAANAAESKTKLFFSTEFIFKGETTCLFLEFLKPESELVDILIKDFGLDEKVKEQIHKACQKIIDKPMPNHAEDPQILWPMDDNCENYIAMTPVVSVSLMREIELRNKTIRTKIKRRIKSGFLTETIYVGGTKPINAGDFVGSKNGGIKLLRSYLKKPTFFKLTYKIIKQKTIFNLNLKEYIAHIINSKDFDYFHFLIELFFDEAKLLRSYCLSGKKLPHFFDKMISTSEYKYLTRNLLDKNEMKNLKEIALKKLNDSIHTEENKVYLDLIWTHEEQSMLEEEFNIKFDEFIGV